MTLLKRIKDFNPETKIEGIQVQEMVSQGVEFQLGMVNNPELGPVMTCGFGGIFVELMKDIIIRIPPLDLPQVHQMIQELKGYALLRGLRGGNALDVDALIEAISNFSHLCVDLCNLKNIKISEMEINPLMVLKKGCGVKAVDFRVIYQ